MQALGMIETKGLLAAIEAADTMLKAADVSFFKKQKVGGGRVTVLVTGDVAAVKAAVDAGVSAVKQIQDDCLLSCHVIPRPDAETMNLFNAAEQEEVKANTEIFQSAETLQPVETMEPVVIPIQPEEPIKLEESDKTEEPGEDTAVPASDKTEKPESKKGIKNKEK